MEKLFDEYGDYSDEMGGIGGSGDSSSSIPFDEYEDSVPRWEDEGGRI